MTSLLPSIYSRRIETIVTAATAAGLQRYMPTHDGTNQRKKPLLYPVISIR